MGIMSAQMTAIPLRAERQVVLFFDRKRIVIRPKQDARRSRSDGRHDARRVLHAWKAHFNVLVGQLFAHDAAWTPCNANLIKPLRYVRESFGQVHTDLGNLVQMSSVGNDIILEAARLLNVLSHVVPFRSRPAAHTPRRSSLSRQSNRRFGRRMPLSRRLRPRCRRCVCTRTVFAPQDSHIPCQLRQQPRAE